MSEYPILFNGDMVRAILQGRKTQTRRIMQDSDTGLHLCVKCPSFQFGDKLWVRETFCEPINHGDLINEDLRAKVRGVEFAADMGIERFPLGGNFRPMLRDFRWRPSIHMPRWASRITLEIMDVRAQRLQDLTEEDAEEEGIDTWHDFPNHRNYPDGGCNCGDFPSSDRFSWLWNSIYAKRGFGWDANPWLWAISFKVVKP